MAPGLLNWSYIHAQSIELCRFAIQLAVATEKGTRHEKKNGDGPVDEGEVGERLQLSLTYHRISRDRTQPLFKGWKSQVCRFDL